MRPTPNPQEERDLDEKELSELTRKTAEMLFGPRMVEGLKTLKKVLEERGEWKEEK